MRRRLLQFATALSFGLFVIFAVLWPRSYWRYDLIIWYRTDYSFGLTSGDGRLAIAFGPRYNGLDALRIEPQFSYINYELPRGAGLRLGIEVAEYRSLSRLGFAYNPNRLKTEPGPPKLVYHTGHKLYFPHWFAVAAFGIIPVIRFWRWQRIRRRTASGLCVACGYDLRATPGKCPECGAVPSEAA